MKNNNQKGFSIVEIIVYVGLLSIFMLVLLDVFITILNARLEAESTSTLNQDARYVLSKLEYDIGNADSVTMPLNNGDSSNTLVLTQEGIDKTYSLDGSGNFLISSGFSSYKLNGEDTDVTDLSFKKLGNSEPGDKPTIKISYTVRSKIIRKGGTQTLSFNTTVGLR